MEKEEIIDLSNNPQDASNKKLIDARDTLIEEFNNTKDIIINLTRHLDGVESLYNKINNEIEKRVK
jgi:hypothetical protein